MTRENSRKTIFISGAASGIGRATAQFFANKGWFVGLADINAAGLAETAAMLADGQSSTHLLDVRDRARWDAALAEFTANAGGRLDVMFNNAGVGHGGVFADVPDTEHELVVDVNIKGMINGAQAAFPYLSKTPGSCLLNTCSAAGLVAGAGMVVYAMSKFAVRAMTEALEIEWQPAGVRVASLMPSFIETPLLDNMGSGSNRNIRERVTEAGLEITPVGEVAQAAWDAVHGTATHTVVGKTAKRLKFMTRWFPGIVRKSMAKSFLEAEQN